MDALKISVVQFENASGSRTYNLEVVSFSFCKKAQSEVVYLDREV